MELLRIQILPLIIFAQEHDQALVMSQRHCRGDNFQMADKAIVSIMVCVQSERQHAAESALHLLYGDVMSLVAFQSGICHKS